MKPIFAPIAVFLALSTVASAEIFELAGGGRIEGKLLNPKEIPRRTYVIEVADGARVVLELQAVRKVSHARPDVVEYERIRPTFPDTVKAQWALAEWCREKRLSQQREAHLRRVIELDPEHAQARRSLGYSKIDGRWTTQEEIMTSRGYVRHKGRWRTPQEIELLEKQEVQKEAQKEWYVKLKRWRGWLDSDRRDEGRRNIIAIDDPVATKALVSELKDEPNLHVRKLYVAALAKIDTVEANMALAIATIDDDAEEVRLTCLDHLEKKPRPEAVSYLVRKLKDKNNSVVNLAAYALGRLKDPSSVGPLIDALVTVHKYKITNSSGGINPSFSPSGGGLSVGKRPKIITKHISNQAVLDALVRMTGVNFNFDERAWKHWHAAQKKPAPSIESRRD